jgi:hypothetical protein
VQIAGGYYGDKNGATAVAPADDNKGKGWPIRLLSAYVVRPGELFVVLPVVAWVPAVVVWKMWTEAACS